MQHWTVGIWLGGFCLWLSLTLIIRMWLIHRRAAFIKKFIWSLILIIPFFGWVAYGGGFKIPAQHGDTVPPSVV